jgi:hypothetical protein
MNRRLATVLVMVSLVLVAGVVFMLRSKKSVFDETANREKGCPARKARGFFKIEGAEKRSIQIDSIFKIEPGKIVALFVRGTNGLFGKSLSSSESALTFLLTP